MYLFSRLLVTSLFASSPLHAHMSNMAAKTIYEFTAKDIDGNDVSLEKYKGHVTIIVNVASQ